MGVFSLSCHTPASLSVGYDPDKYVVEHSGEVLYQPEDEEGETGLGPPEKAGEFTAQRVLGNLAAADGVDIFEVCDAAGQELSDLSCVLFSLKTRDYRPWVLEKFGAMPADFLLVESVVLDPRWRGLNVGLLVLRRLIDLFAPPFGLAVCQPFPFGAETPEEVREGTLKLRRYVRRVGFRRLRKTPFYGLSTCHALPRYEDLLSGGK
jgi:hypothetical protein